MGLAEDLQGIVQSVINTSLDNIPRSITLRRTEKPIGTGSNNYDPSQPAKVPQQFDYQIPKALILNFKEKDIDGTNIVTGDLQVLFASLDYEFCPEVDDLIISDSVIYKVINVTNDPVKSFWKLQIRK
jgi:hypothetical protein